MLVRSRQDSQRWGRICKVRVGNKRYAFRVSIAPARATRKARQFARDGRYDDKSLNFADARTSESSEKLGEDDD